MHPSQDGPASALFHPIKLKGNCAAAGLAKLQQLSKDMRDASAHAPSGECVCWGIPFEVRSGILALDKPLELPLNNVRAPWLVFLHTTDEKLPQPNQDGLYTPARGLIPLNAHAADYVFVYADGVERRIPIRWRREVGMYRRPWGENCFQCVAHRKPHPVNTLTDEPLEGHQFGWTQMRVGQPDLLPFIYWVWAWENPRPRAPLSALRIDPKEGKLLLAAISAGKVGSNPLRWEPRKKAILTLPREETFNPSLGRLGLLQHLQLDLGQVISAEPRRIYPKNWVNTASMPAPPPELSSRELLIEYTAHPEACFAFKNGKRVAVSKLAAGTASRLEVVAAPARRVRVRVIDKMSNQPVPVRLHVHGQSGEYLAPLDRHRIPNGNWFEDYGPEYVGENLHYSTYIPGETTIDLPAGRVCFEISKGFEIRPVRKAVNVTRATESIDFTVEKVLPWREHGWVTADTHVHFLSPSTARLEGCAEGVNVVNLLASQWGEMMTNVGDFDSQLAFGNDTSGEWLVRMGTENRQHVLGHVSLLGYHGNALVPMTLGGPDESALGDPVAMLIMEWAQLCREHGGLAVLPHFPEPRAENAAALVEGAIDAVEMASGGWHLGGINPYSLSDWYRYLNCGYFVPAVGGTDKMSSGMLLGAIRTYAKLPENTPLDYETWKQAIRSGNTFVSFGPLIEFDVDGRCPGARFGMSRSGGTVTASYKVASVTIPMTRIDLLVNGEIRESRRVNAESDEGHWNVKIDRSSWIALLVRAQQPGRPEWIAAHSSPVIIDVDGTQFAAAADALTILEQIEGALAFVDTLGTRADAATYKRIRMALTSAHRNLHNRMHKMGIGHEHREKGEKTKTNRARRS